MVVAVHLVEALALVSVLGILFGLSAVIVLSAKVLYTCLFIFTSGLKWIGSILYSSEKTIFYSLLSLCNMNGMFSDANVDGDDAEAECKCFD